MTCILCGYDHDFKCALVKAYEYHPDGTLKRVEFVTFADMRQPSPLLNMPEHGTRQ